MAASPAGVVGVGVGVDRPVDGPPGIDVESPLGAIEPDLGRLERDIIGMARYRVLLRAKLVESPKLAFQTKRVDGGRDSLHVGDKTIRITDQPGLQRNPRRWEPGARCPQ